MPLTLQELAIYIPNAISVFEEYNLDYYQHGFQTLRSACSDKGISFEEVDAKLTLLDETPDTALLIEMSPERLIDYVNSKYHNEEEYLLNRLEWLLNYAVYQSEEQVLVEAISPIYQGLKKKLSDHCKLEDSLFFPWMRKLVQLNKNRLFKEVSKQMAGLNNPIAQLREEHIYLTDRLKCLKKQARYYHIPVNSSDSFHELMTHFKEFELGFHMHLHIENNVLFPKLLAMEQFILFKN